MTPDPLAARLEDSPSVMVQEQIARLMFIADRRDFAGKAVLDVGCGRGLDSVYLLRRQGAARVLGLDIVPKEVAAARQACPEGEFIIADACDPTLDLGLGQWPLVLYCEAFEHVIDPERLLDLIARHLAPDGTAYITTPDRPVFSLDREPSPMNRDHVREYDPAELQSLLDKKFARVQVWGQRLRSTERFAARQKAVARSVRDHRFLGGLYWSKPVRHLWKLIRLELLWRKFEGGGQLTRHDDFEFVQPVGDDSIWLCALVGKHP